MPRDDPYVTKRSGPGSAVKRPKHDPGPTNHPDSVLQNRKPRPNAKKREPGFSPSSRLNRKIK